MFGAARRRVFAARPESWKIARDEAAGKRGLEIGGPSSLFARGGILPLYPLVASLDNCDFSAATTVGRIEEGYNFVFDAAHAAGLQRITDAVDLCAIPNDAYELLLASHVLEHIANPLCALREWSRVLKPRGVMMLVIPHKEGTFDHRRQVTTLEHLLDDLRRGTQEDDFTHLDESLQLHDFARDPQVLDAQEFANRCTANEQYRCIHHHVFDTRLVGEVVDKAGLQIKALEAIKPHHIVVVAENVPYTTVRYNSGFLTTAALSKSPFVSDHV